MVAFNFIYRLASISKHQEVAKPRRNWNRRFKWPYHSTYNNDWPQVVPCCSWCITAHACPFNNPKKKNKTQRGLYITTD